jgi:hypothetical protein
VERLIFHERLDRAQWRAVSDKEFLAQEEIELGRVELLSTSEVHRVRHDEEIVLVVFDLGQAARCDAVLDGQGVEREDALQHLLDLLVSRILQVDPEVKSLVRTHDAQGSSSRSRPASLPSLKMKERIMRAGHRVGRMNRGRRQKGSGVSSGAACERASVACLVWKDKESDPRLRW